MRRESAFLQVFLIILVVSSFAALGVSRVEASGTIYIRANGNIDPPDAPISTFDNISYTLTGNITSGADGIVVERDNIMVDGSGFAVEGTLAYPSHGIFLDGRSNVTIHNASIKNFYQGILLNYSSNNRINQNNITDNSNYGIWLNDSSKYNNISGNNIMDNSDGIRLESSSDHNNIGGNTITNNIWYGIELFDSSNDSISGNTITDSFYSVGLIGSSNNSISGNTFTGGGLGVQFSYSNSVENNTVNSRPLVYLEGVVDYSVGDAGQVVLVRCDRISVENLNLSQTSTGIRLWETNNSIVSVNNIAATSKAGILLDYSSNNSINRNAIANNGYCGVFVEYSSNYNSINGNNVTNNGDCGIRLSSSSNHNSISGNNITGSGSYGVDFEFSSKYNNISGNNIMDNIFGVFLGRSSNTNRISENNITNNVRGVYLYDSSNNTFYHNNFVNNTYVVSGPNFWDNGYEGNYWSNYNGVDFYHGPFQNETGSDGIGDSPYVIDANNADHYPLIKPFPWDSHDVGIAYIGRVYTFEPIIFPCVFPPKPFAGLLLHLDVFVMNYGDYSETLSLTLYANETVIGNVTDVALTAKNSTILDVPWNPIGFSYGDYTITAVLEPVLGETSLADNTFVNGLVYVGIPGDVNRDNKIDMRDIATIAKNFMRPPGSPFWNPSYDLNDDGKIDFFDIGYSARHFGEHYS